MPALEIEFYWYTQTGMVVVTCWVKSRNEQLLIVSCQYSVKYLARLPVQTEEAWMTSNHHAPYDLGYTCYNGWYNESKSVTASYL